MGSPTGTGRISNRGHEDGLGVRVRRCLKGKRPRSPTLAPKGKKAQTSKAVWKFQLRPRRPVARPPSRGVVGGTRAEEAAAPRSGSPGRAWAGPRAPTWRHRRSMSRRLLGAVVRPCRASDALLGPAGSCGLRSSGPGDGAWLC